MGSDKSLFSIASYGKSIRDIVDVAINQAREADAEREFLIKRAPNIIEWITRPEFGSAPEILGDGTEEHPPYWGSYQMLRDFFELRCPKCNHGSADVWGKSKLELEGEILLTYKASLDDDVCPKCSTTRSEFIDEGIFKGYRALTAIVGMRSGKSHTIAYLASYVEHVLLTLAHRDRDHLGLFRYLNLAPSEHLDLTFLASSQKQGDETIWAKYRGARLRSSWFRRYTPWIKLQERLQETPEGMEKWTYSEAHTKIVNGAARLIFNALNSNSDTIVGRTRIFAAADEICRMKQTDSAFGADEIYRGLDASLMTVKSCVMNYDLKLKWLGSILAVSSPMSIEDKGMRLLREGEKVPLMYTLHKATWEFNPYQPRENFDEDFIKDPIGATRNFGARPPAAAHPLVYDAVAFEESVLDWELKPTAKFEQYSRTDATGRAYVGLKLLDADFIRSGPARYIAFDPGLTFDAFAGACAHPELDGEGRIITVFDWIIRLVPQQGQEVDFDAFFPFIQGLAQRQTIARVEYDQWNSAQMIQSIRGLGIPSEPQPTKDTHFTQFVRDAMSGRIRMLPPEEEDYDIKTPDVLSAPASALYELERLDIDPLTGKISNPLKGGRRGYNSDDVARVVVHVHRLVQDIGFTEKFDDQSRKAKRIRAEAFLNAWESNNSGQVVSKTAAMRRNGGGRGW